MPPGRSRSVHSPPTEELQPRPPAPTPMMLLQNHHERLASLEKEHANTVNRLISLQTNTVSEESKEIAPDMNKEN